MNFFTLTVFGSELTSTNNKRTGHLLSADLFMYRITFRMRDYFVLPTQILMLYYTSIDKHIP